MMDDCDVQVVCHQKMKNPRDSEVPRFKEDKEDPAKEVSI